MKVSHKRLLVRAKRFFKGIVEADWSNPLNILLLLSVLVAPFVAFNYVMTGLLLGLLLCISILWTVDHLPNSVKKLIRNNPVVSDFVLSTVALFGVGTLFGPGLVLAMGAVFCGIILNWCIPNIQLTKVTA